MNITIILRILPLGFMLFLISLSILFDGCQKSDDPLMNDTIQGDTTHHDTIADDTTHHDTIPTDTIPADTLPLSSKIIIGDTAGMCYFPEYRTISGGENSFGQIELDLDFDQVTDIVLEAGHVVSMGTNYKYSQINLWNSDVSIFGLFASDTLWSKKDTLPWPNSNTYYVNSISSCHPLPAFDHTYPWNAFHALELNVGDSLSRDMYFFSEEVSFIYNKSGSMWLGNDSITQVLYSSIRDCYALPHGPEFYLGFRIGKDEDVLLGWLKLSVPSELRINLHEWAVQRRKQH